MQVVGVELDRFPNRVSLHILDDGKGIDAQERDQVFEPFFTTHAAGTGLGLYIARELCEANGARLILLENAPGAHFCISFGLTCLDQNPGPSTDMTGKMRVLIVDDEPDIRELLDMTWRAWGFLRLRRQRCRGAAVAAGKSYSLCLTDMRMPDGDGLELVRISKHNARACRWP